MPNVVQHTLWPFVWTLAIGTTFFIGTLFVIAACLILALPMAFYTGLPDMYGVTKGSSPGWGFSPKKGNWAGYTSAHVGDFAHAHRFNPFYKFHLWQDRYSHGDPKYLLRIFGYDKKREAFYNEIINDILVLGLLTLLIGLAGALALILTVGGILYAYKIYVWKKVLPNS